MFPMKYGLITTMWHEPSVSTTVVYHDDREYMRKLLGEERKRCSYAKQLGEISNYQVFLAQIIDGSSTIPDPTPVTPTKQDIKEEFISYAAAKGYAVDRERVRVGKYGITAYVSDETPPNLKDFSFVDRIKGEYRVSLSTMDFKNEVITNKLFKI